MNTEALGMTGVYILRLFAVDTIRINRNAKTNKGLNCLEHTAQIHYIGTDS